jgi:hypothetical protein
MDIRQIAVSYFKQVRRQLKNGQKEGCEHTRLLRPKICVVCHNWLLHIAYTLFLPLGGSHEGVCQLWRRSDKAA